MERIWRWFERLVPPFPAQDRGVPPKGLVRFILFYTQGLWKFLIIIALLTAFMAIGEALFFSCMGLIVDWTTSTLPSFFIEDHGTVIHSLILHQTVSGNYPMQIRWQIHRYMLGQSLSFFTDEFAGRVANKVMQTAMAVRTSVLKLIDVLVHLCVYFATMLWMLGDADLVLMLPLIVWFILYSLALGIFIPNLRKQAQVQADTRSDMVGRVVDSYVNIATVKLFGGKGREAKYAKAGMEGFIKAEYKALRILTLLDVSVQFLNYALLISITVLSLWLWIHYAITPGSIAIAVAVAIRVINMSRWMMWEVGAIFENIGMVYDGMNTIARPVEIKDPKNPKTLDKVKGKIEFSHVAFGYTGGKKVFEDLSFAVNPGEKVGIVGRSGAGKSTLINLLLRFYEVDGGTIFLDGTDIRELAQDEMRDNFAMVSQDPSLMHRTIAENISYGVNECDANSMEKAAELTDSLSFIKNLSGYRGGRGFSTMVGERGAKLSGGQRQRIALARVILKNAPILILDEATSALDSESEAIVQENLAQVMQGRTVLAIAHRLSTLNQMDKILVLDEGKIVESGTHKELIELNGIYARLWERQAGGFIGE